MRKALTLLIVLAAGAALASGAERHELAFGALVGQISSPQSPLEHSQVYAYHLADQRLDKAITDVDGNFRFDRLPAGLYKIIAFKDGFMPAIALLTRSTSQAVQYLNMEMVEETIKQGETSGEFWSVRERIPSDVLRDLEVAEVVGEPLTQVRVTSARLEPRAVEAEMQAIAGVDQNVELGSAAVTGGRVGVEGSIADLQVGLTGRFLALESAPSSNEPDLSGRTQSLSLEVRSPGSTGTDVRVSTMSNQMTTLMGGARDTSVVGLERHQVSWSQNVGDHGQSSLVAEYSEESNFFRQAPIEPFGIPDASRSWRVEGSYSTSPSQRSTVQTGFRYREREAVFDAESRHAREPFDFVPAQRVDLFGRGGLQVNPDILVEFGLYSTLRDGSLSLSPSGGMVFHLGEGWRAQASGSVKIHEEVSSLHPDFTPALFGEYDVCQTAEQFCYKVSLARETGEQEEMRVGVVHRRFAETLHLYFNKDFFSRLESLYLVRGDNLPELQFAATRRLSPRVLARLSSNLAAGGGGILYATDKTSYENQIRYLVTSLDTQFEQTSTGVFVAFHHLAQQLNPVRGDARQATPAPQMELERLQLMLTQDLDLLHSLASDWAVHLNMELSRGSGTDGDPHLDEDLRKRVMGGLTVSF